MKMPLSHLVKFSAILYALNMPSLYTDVLRYKGYVENIQVIDENLHLLFLVLFPSSSLITSPSDYYNLIPILIFCNTYFPEIGLLFLPWWMHGYRQGAKCGSQECLVIPQ